MTAPPLLLTISYGREVLYFHFITLLISLLSNFTTLLTLLTLILVIYLYQLLKVWNIRLCITQSKSENY